jgi:hypothetical protein
MKKLLCASLLFAGLTGTAFAEGTAGSLSALSTQPSMNVFAASRWIA